MGLSPARETLTRDIWPRSLAEMGFIVDTYSETMNKYIKISTFLRRCWKNIIWLEDTDPEYINEILTILNLQITMTARQRCKPAPEDRYRGLLQSGEGRDIDCSDYRKTKN
ncbi:MAG: hypothetical protein ACLVJO_10850 [[Clostridium] scindens]